MLAAPLVKSLTGWAALSHTTPHTQQAQAHTQVLPDVADLKRKEREIVEKFMRGGCGCHLKCSSHYSSKYVLDVRANCHQLTQDHLDMLLLGQLMASFNINDSVVTESQHVSTPRQRG